MASMAEEAFTLRAPIKRRGTTGITRWGACAWQATGCRWAVDYGSHDFGISCGRDVKRGKHLRRASPSGESLLLGMKSG